MASFIMSALGGLTALAMASVVSLLVVEILRK
jgi:hypothetical protein